MRISTSLKPLIFHSLSFTALSSVVFGASVEDLLVHRIELQLSDEKVFRFDELVLSAFSSSDRIAQVKRDPKQVNIRAIDFGQATVTVYLESGTVVLYRLNVVPVPIEVSRYPLDLSRHEKGGEARIGTRLGFRSTRGLFENWVVQEEFLSFASGGKTMRHSGSVRTGRPFLYQQPKPDRFIESVFYQLDGDLLRLRIGDVDYSQRGDGQSGSIRGGRVDWRGKEIHPYLFGGLFHSGVQNFIFGTEQSGVGGAGISYKSSHYSAQAYALGFEKNEALQIKNGGIEMGIASSVRLGVLEELSVRAISDKNLHTALEGSSTLVLPPFGFSATAGHSPDGFEVVSFPNRFGSDIFTYALLGTVGSFPKKIRLAGGYSKALSLSEQDLYPGKSEFSSTNLSLNWQPTTGVELELYANDNQSQFLPFDTGTGTEEKGNRLEGRTEFSISDVHHLTLAGEITKIQLKHLNLKYENESGALGWKRILAKEGTDSIQVEVGLSHFLYPDQPSESGYYSLLRLTGMIHFYWIGLDGVLQNEMRFTEPNRNNLRAQISSNIWLHRRHEVRLALFHNFEWFRNIYSNSRGFFLSYVMHFGDVAARSSLVSMLARHRISGRVYLHNEIDRPYSNIEIKLKSMASGVERSSWTSVDGRFEFVGLEVGAYSLWLDRSKSELRTRLVSASPKILEIQSADLVYDFVFSDFSELSGQVFNDVSENDQLDQNEPILEGTTIKLRGVGTLPSKTIVSADGTFLSGPLPPGAYELSIEPQSLPPGYRLDKLRVHRIEVPANGFVVKNISTYAERAVSGMAFMDKNRNRKLDPGERGVDGLRVRLASFETKTGDGGRFIFRHLPPLSGSVHILRHGSEKLSLGEGPTLISDVLVPISP